MKTKWLLITMKYACSAGQTNLSPFVTMTDLSTDCYCVYCTLFKYVENYFVPNFIEVDERTGC